jgi:hypothetical protein
MMSKQVTDDTAASDADAMTADGSRAVEAT